MLHFVLGHTLLSEIIYDLKLTIEKVFGAGFFKSVQVIGNISDSIKIMSEELNKQSYELKLPALTIQLNDFAPYQNIMANPYISHRSTLNYGVNYYPLLYNKSKDSGVVCNIQYYSMLFEVNIATESEFLTLDLKRYLENRFPLNIPVRYGDITTLLPITKSIYDDLTQNSNWDFENDEIYYLYQKIDYLTGQKAFFVPFIVNPLLVNQSIDKQDKEKFSNKQYCVNTLLIELRFFAPMTLFAVRNKKIIRDISIHMSELTNPILYSSYLPIGYINISDVLNISKRFRGLEFAGAETINKDNIIDSDTDKKIYKIHFIGSKKLKDNDNVNSIDDIKIVIPVIEDKIMANNENMATCNELVLRNNVDIKYDKDSNSFIWTLELEKYNTSRCLLVYNELKNFVDGEKRLDIFMYTNKK